MKSAFGCIVAALAFAAPAHETSTPVRVGTLPLVTCKNHFILDEPCGPLDTTIPVPTAIAVDAQGNVFFSGPNIVYKLAKDGVLTRVAGNGQPGFSGDGGAAVDALLDIPYEEYPERQRDPIDFSELVGPLAVDAAGNLYIGDAYNNRVRKVTPDGIIETVAGNGEQGHFGGFPADADGAPATSVTLWWPQGLGVDAKGRLFIADSTGVLLQIDDAGRLVQLTHNDCGTFESPGLCAPEGIAVNAAGEAFATDAYCRVRKVRGPDDVETVAGDARPDPHGFVFTCGYSGDGGPATLAGLEAPFAVALDGAANLFIADTYNHCIRKVDGNGIITTVAGQCGHAGSAPASGPALVAGLWEPHGIAADSTGNLYIADTRNECIRKVTPEGVMTTIAGNC